MHCEIECTHQRTKNSFINNMSLLNIGKEEADTRTKNVKSALESWDIRV